MGSSTLIDTKVSIKPVSDDELPPEFKKFDKPFGIDQHIFNFITFGILGHVSTIYVQLLWWPLGIIPGSNFIFGIFYGYLSGLGTTVGSHRYWTHRTFKAKLPLQILLMLMQTAGMQYPIFIWCRDHRVHHKYTDTDADPTNASRGFWFSHMLWYFKPRKPEVVEKLKIVDISDLARDPVVRFQSKYYWELLILVYFMLPMSIYKYLWPELTWLTILALNFSRHCFSVHFTFLVNSFAHMWGDKPYDKYIRPTDNIFVSWFAIGEGWHNYHHTFPWDYKTSEYGWKINLSTIFIDFFAMIGWAYDLKTVSHKLLEDRINRTGDGFHPLYKKETEINKIQLEEKDLSYSSCWGWGDNNLKEKDLEVTEIKFPSKQR